MEKKCRVKRDKQKIYSKIIDILGILIALISLVVSIQVRGDTAELTKFSEKPIYYKIKLFPNSNTGDYSQWDKYIRWNLDLIVDDFEITKKGFLDVNYNSLFTHVTYYMVYDYDLSEEPKYYYKFDSLDDRTQVQIRLENQYNISVSSMNYSLTPNKEYCYVLIHTETLSEQNLDLVFFKFNKEQESKLDFIEVDGTYQIDITDIKYKHLISRDYYTSTWADTQSQWEDIDFMFDVYEDLREQIKQCL